MPCWWYALLVSVLLPPFFGLSCRLCIVPLALACCCLYLWYNLHLHPRWHCSTQWHGWVLLHSCLRLLVPLGCCGVLHYMCGGELGNCDCVLFPFFLCFDGLECRFGYAAKSFWTILRKSWIISPAVDTLGDDFACQVVWSFQTDIAFVELCADLAQMYIL